MSLSLSKVLDIFFFFISEGKQRIQAHKGLMSCRCERFRALFGHGMIESRSKEVPGEIEFTSVFT